MGIESFAVRRVPERAFSVTGGIRRVDAGGATLLLEGAVFRIGGQRAADPHATLLDRLRARGPAAFADATGDFVACYVTPEGTYAFKSFTSQYQLYLREADGLVANRLFSFATDDAPAFDEGYFARHTLIVPGMQFHLRRTPLAGVDRVLPGEVVSIGERIERRQLVTRRYRYKLDPAQRREEVAPEILRILRETIRDQIDAYPAAGIVIEISGGLDSSFVACLVGEMTSGAKGVMFSQPDVPSHRESEGYATEVARRYGIDLEIVPPSALPAVPLTDPPYGDEPSDFFWFGELFSACVAGFARPGSLVFTGFGADQLFLRSPAFLPYLVARGEWSAFRHALGPAGRLLSRAPLNLALQSLVSQLPRETYYRLARPFAGRRWNPLDVSDVNQHRMLYTPVEWLARGAEQEAYELERLAAEAALAGDGIICDDWGYFAAPRAVAFPHFAPGGLVDASPFCDLRLIDFMYDEVSALLVHDYEGRYKELLREAQRGIVPESLRSRRNDTFVFNAFQARYVERARDWFQSLLAEAPAGWIEPRGAARALEELGFGLMTSSTRSLVALLGYLVWRRAFGTELAGRRTARASETWVPAGR